MLASGLKKTVKINIVKGSVKTTKISGLDKKVTLKKGASLKLAPVISPFTSQSRLSYSSANKKIASVSSKGVIKAKKAGKTKITVKSGSKKFVITLTVKK